EIPTETLVISLVAPMVETTIVAPPTGLRYLIPYSNSDSDSPDGMISLEYISLLPATSPFICTDSLETSRDPSNGPPSQDPYEAILFGRPYRTHPNGPRKVMTARKRVGTLPARRLAWRRVSPCSSDHQSSSGSSSDASPAHALGHPTLDQSLSGSALLSTMCPPTTSDSSSKDSPSESYAGLSCKRCRSPAATMPLPIFASGALVPTRIDLLPPRKRFRDSYSSEESI
ncbi:hypothetical protein Tco_0107257, partial [Tanacetum coccineum]